MALTQQQKDCAALFLACGCEKEEVPYLIIALKSSENLEMIGSLIVEDYDKTGKFPSREKVIRGVSFLVNWDEAHAEPSRA